MSNKKYTYDYPRPAVTADVAVLRITESPEILLVKRRLDPFMGMWALPGGFMNMDETLEEAARRELSEETGIKAGELIKFDTYDRPDRDPRGRTITQVFVMIWDKKMGEPVAADDAEDFRWFELSSLPDIGFDHASVISDVIQMMKTE